LFHNQVPSDWFCRLPARAGIVISIFTTPLYAELAEGRELKKTAAKLTQTMFLN
jgi:hypothetical protein